MSPDSMIELITPIADILQLRLGLHTPKNKEARVVGLPNSTRTHKLSGIELEMTVKASYIGPKAAAVLVRVKGDLYIYAAYFKAVDSTVLTIYNAEKQPFTPAFLTLINGIHPHSAYELLKPALVKMSTKKRTDSLWASIEAPPVKDLI